MQARPTSIIYPIIWAAPLVAVMAAASVRADVATVKGERPDVGCKLLEIDDCRLHYRLYTATIEADPLDDIVYLQVTDWTSFNRAEKQFREENWESAIRNYERALKEMDATGMSYLDRQKDESKPRLDRRLLVQCRILAAADRLGRFDQAVAAYVEVVEQIPDCFEALQPTNIPKANSTFIEPARRIIDQAIQRHQQDRLGARLARWANTWLGENQPPIEPNRPATQPSETSEKDSLIEDSQAAGHDASLPARLREIVVLIAEEKFQAALDKIDRTLPEADAELIPELYYWQGRAISGKIERNDRSDARRERTRAGLAYMRVAIVYPHHSRAAECLFRSAEICRNRQQVEPARRLYSELCQGHPDADPWTPQAAELLKTLSAAGETRPADEPVSMERD